MCIFMGMNDRNVTELYSIIPQYITYVAFIIP